MIGAISDDENDKYFRRVDDPRVRDRRRTGATARDARATLKAGSPGVKAAAAAWNLELVSNLPKPEGFADALPLGARPPAPVAGALAETLRGRSAKLR